MWVPFSQLQYSTYYVVRTLFSLPQEKKEDYYVCNNVCNWRIIINVDQ